MSETKTPEQWAFALGQYKVGPKPRRIKQLSWQHNVAAVVHGWAQHEHDAQSPMQLTKSAYQGAIDAVEKQTSDGTLSGFPVRRCMLADQRTCSSGVEASEWGKFCLFLPILLY